MLNDQDKLNPKKVAARVVKRQITINWATSDETPDKRPLRESWLGLAVELMWAVGMILFLIAITTVIWLVLR
ncbi:MAG TPA: hypothetical protein PKV16_01965 [Caldisericia bacterium]|nr:hypothetical protein [Caldisericia bacterium]HPF48080.1 hypothetical protein [Caldisericia bacterium]HPI83983.1 hypothetical protein [Caldisericia bacterium]HPQ92533.1 hypothetical protein [Caldisericia bacterium]HRV74369.1 hypothetical protein [Caldisericia bacterium]